MADKITDKEWVEEQKKEETLTQIIEELRRFEKMTLFRGIKRESYDLRWKTFNEKLPEYEKNVLSEKEPEWRESLECVLTELDAIETYLKAGDGNQETCYSVIKEAKLAYASLVDHSITLRKLLSDYDSKLEVVPRFEKLISDSQRYVKSHKQGEDLGYAPKDVAKKLKMFLAHHENLKDTWHYKQLVDLTESISNLNYKKKKQTLIFKRETSSK